VKWLVAFAILLRLSMLTLEPSSTDTKRFFADGLNVAQGKNPYTAPAPFEIKYGHLRSFYPPLQQVFFAGAVAAWPNPKIFRVLGGLAELLFLVWYLRRHHRQAAVSFFLLFNPISIHEIWREGHLDHIGIYALYFAIISRRAKRYAWAFAAIAWKFAGIIAIAFRRRFAFAVILAAFFASQLAPAIYWTPFAESGLSVYKTYWHHGNGFVHLFESFGFAAAHGVYIVQLSIIALGLITGAFWFFRKLHIYDAIWFSLGSLLVLFPVQHPWYYFLLLPGVLLSRRWQNTLMLVMCLTPLTYLGYVGHLKSLGFIIISLVWFVGAALVLSRQSKTRLG